MKLPALFLATVLVCHAADQVTVVQSGEAGHWKLTLTGSLPPQPLNRIGAQGDVKVRGKRARDIRYTITQEVIAPDEAAVRQLAPFFRPRAGNGQMVFPQPSAVGLEIPRSTALLSLRSNAGTIDAADLDGSLRAEAGAGRIVLDRIGGNAEVYSNGGSATFGSIGGSVRCYSGGGSIRAVRINGSAAFETNGGDIQLGEVRGAVTAITAAGGIHIERAGAGVYADTRGGPIVIQRAAGMVVANNAGGPIEIGGASSVQCRNAGGAIRLTNVSGSIRAATERGSIAVAIAAGRRLEDSFLSTGGGDITVLMPSNMGVTVEAEASEARGGSPVDSDFSGLWIRALRSSVTASGKINGGGPLLRLSGTGGRIEVRRK